MIKLVLKSIAICATLILLLTSCESQKTEAESDFTFLDTNKDGVINPYEALDVLIQMREQSGKELLVSDFDQQIKEVKNAKEAEVTEMFADFDKDGNGKIQFDEVGEEMIDFIEAMDADNSKSVDHVEMANFDFTDFYLLDEEGVKERVKNTFEEYNATDKINILEVKEERRGRFEEWDGDSDGFVTRDEMYKFISADNIPVKFDIIEDTAYMTGVITSELPTTIIELLFEHPNVSLIEMITVPGSIDDHANLRASLLVNKFGITTKLNSKSLVASGGTDFFTAGKERIVEKGAFIGVHSWGGGSTPAVEVPREDEVHQKYLKFYRAVDIPEDFYWYTLEMASAADMHRMTEEEITKYKIRTK